ncbi:MAG: hypothetical protein IJO57_04875 [Bacilli bacterium]|nr:hypothetical protein [Bacilli bacterium]
MDNKNKKVIIISIFIIIGIALICLSFIGINKIFNSSKDTINDNGVENNVPKDETSEEEIANSNEETVNDNDVPEEEENEDEIDNPWIDDKPIGEKYSFGNKVSISKLKEVKDYYHPGDIEDFSKWFVLEDDGTYITLISAEIFGKIDPRDDGVETSFFKKYNIKFGNDGYSRLLNRDDLELYFECNFDSLKCTKNIASFKDISPYGGTLTSATIQNKIVVYNFENNSLSIEEYVPGLYSYLITMKILKENL